MTSNHHAPYDLGYTRATMAVTKRSETVKWSKPQKGCLSSDCSLQLDYMKLESLVIANQNVAVNTFPGLVHTARHTMGAGNARSQWPNRVVTGIEVRSFRRRMADLMRGKNDEHSECYVRSE